MKHYEYIAIPAPMRSGKAKNAKTPSERYAVTLTDSINQMANTGWEYLRAETLPSEERSGLTGRTTLFHNLLIFRRPVVKMDSVLTQSTDTYPSSAEPPRPDNQEPAKAKRIEPTIAKAPPAPEITPAPEPDTEDPAPSSPVFSEKMRPIRKTETS